MADQAYYISLRGLVGTREVAPKGDRGQCRGVDGNFMIIEDTTRSPSRHLIDNSVWSLCTTTYQIRATGEGKHVIKLSAYVGSWDSGNT